MDRLGRVSEGNALSAAQENSLREIAERRFSGMGFASDLEHSIVPFRQESIRLYEITKAAGISDTWKEIYYLGKPVVTDTDSDYRYRMQDESEEEELFWPVAPHNADEVEEDQVYSDTADIHFAAGDRVYTILTHEEHRWILGGNNWTIRAFELKDDLTPGSYADAYLTDDIPSGNIASNHDIEFVVHDSLGCHRGRGYDAQSLGYHGSLGYCFRRPLSSQWEILTMQPVAYMVKGAAYTDWGFKSGTEDRTLILDGIQVMSPVGGLFVTSDYTMPNGPLTVYYEDGQSGHEDDELIAVWNEANVRYELLPCQGDGLRLFELKDDLTPGSYADAYRVEWSTTTYSVDTGEVFQVNSLNDSGSGLGMFRGRAKDKFSSPHDQGSWGWAVWARERKQWEVVQMEPTAMMVRGNATADWESSTLAITATGREIMQPVGAILTDQDPAGNLTVYNPTGLAGLSGDDVIAVWNEDDDRWEVLPGSNSWARTGGQRWAEVQSGFSNDAGSSSQLVSVKQCEYTGASVTGTAFNAKTEIRDNRDTALFTGYIVRYVDDPQSGDKVIVSDIWDDPINTVRLVAADAAIRDGWEEVTDARDRYLMGGTSYESTGGEAWPALDIPAHVVGAHGSHAVTTTCIKEGEGAAVTVVTSVTGSHTNDHSNLAHSGIVDDDRLYIVFKVIKRTS